MHAQKEEIWLKYLNMKASFEGWLRTGLSVKLNVFHHNNSGGSQMNNSHAFREFLSSCNFWPKVRAKTDTAPTHGFHVTTLVICPCVHKV